LNTALKYYCIATNGNTEVVNACTKIFEEVDASE
jgi:hypothetical protein